MKVIWIEEYECGCADEVDRKRDLLGYCSRHGNDWINRYRLVELKDGTRKKFVTRKRKEAQDGPKSEN